jgi:biopolymer transport protein ExbD
MAAKLGGDDEDAIVDINITPFVDIILVVLIIFMVTTSYIVKQSIKVNLPEAASGESTEDSSLGITIDADKNLLLNGEPTTEEDLRVFIRAEKERMKAQGADVVCLIAADHTVPHGEVVGVIDLVKQEGVAKFAINIDPVPLPTEGSNTDIAPPQ